MGAKKARPPVGSLGVLKPEASCCLEIFPADNFETDVADLLESLKEVDPQLARAGPTERFIKRENGTVFGRVCEGLVLNADDLAHIDPRSRDHPSNLLRTVARNNKGISFSVRLNCLCPP